MQRVTQIDARAASVVRGSLIVATCTWLCLGCAAGTPANGMEPAPIGRAGETSTAIPADLQTAVIDDVSRRSGKPRNTVRIIVAEAVTWSDSSLGCPEPDMMYAQALVRGYRVVARVGSRDFDYHAGPKGPPKFCPADRVLPPAPDDRI